MKLINYIWGYMLYWFCLYDAVEQHCLYCINCYETHLFFSELLSKVKFEKGEFRDGIHYQIQYLDAIKKDQLRVIEIQLFLEKLRTKDLRDEFMTVFDMYNEFVSTSTHRDEFLMCFHSGLFFIFQNDFEMAKKWFQKCGSFDDSRRMVLDKYFQYMNSFEI